MPKSFDVLLLFILVTARVRIDTLADMVLPQRHEHVQKLVDGWWPTASFNLLSEWLSDPVTLTLVSLAITLTVIYVAVDVLSQWLSQIATFRLKLTLIYAIIIILVVGKAFLLIGLRHLTEPSAYTHDGGVIQTEITVEYLLQGKNPYIEDYLDTPMASWGREFRTALHHYPYLPWTFLFSTPFYLLSHTVIGWYDQRFLYIALFLITLLMAQSMALTRPFKLLIVMLMGLNPILASDVIFGQNDSFILFWCVLAFWLLRQAEHLGDDEKSAQRKHFVLAANIAYGLACASKPTAWFLAPFWALYLLRHEWGDRFIPSVNRWWFLLKRLLGQVWPVLVVMVMVVGPWFVWSPSAMIDDVWRWSSGTAERPYQIRGWGLSNFVLAFQLVEDRLDFWPFWATEILLATPMLILVLWRQIRDNQLGSMIYSYVALLFVFFYSSRFLNENYLGYLAAFIILAMLIDEPEEEPPTVTNLSTIIANHP